MMKPRALGPCRFPVVSCALIAAAMSASCAQGEDVEMRRNEPRGGGSTEQAFPGESGVVRTASVSFDGKTTTLRVEQIHDALVFEGDIILGAVRPTAGGGGTATDGVASVDPRFLWPDGRVPFTIDPALPNQQRVHDAIAHWHARTRVRFFPRTSEPNFVTFRPSNGCSANLGMTGGQQFVNLATACDTGSTIHEIGHTMGLWHEQSRTDRDHHVIVRWENIQAGHEHNFQTFQQQGFGGQNIGPYDFDSIMHYPSLAFSSNGRPTIVRRDGSSIPGQRAGLSAHDVNGINALYACRVGPFVDICDSLFKDAIAWIHERGIAQGCAADRFCPGDAVSRAQMATFLTRARSLPPGPDAFDDDNGNTHEPGINSVAAAGIAQGCAVRRFCPADPVSRAQMAAFLTRAFALPPGPDAFDDDNGNTHEAAINAVAAAGIVQGCGERRYCPGNPVSRGQMAVMLYRALNR